MNFRTARQHVIRRSGRTFGAALVALAASLPSLKAQEAPAPAGGEAAERGRYVFQAAGCLGCHTEVNGEGEPLAGGRALSTPFGTFHTPNITPDPETGIGAWRLEDFVRALRHGTSPDGDPYYPAFPYTSYAGMADGDLADLYAYLMAQPPVDRPNRDHDLAFPYNLRFALGFWQWLYHEPEVFQPDLTADAEWNRGAYLVRHVTHCGECHSPRNWLGAVDEDQLAGNPVGPDGGRVPNLTPAPGGLAEWSESDIAYALKTGMTPEGDFLSDSMGEVIENSTSKLSDSDLAAIARYLKDLPPRRTP